MVVMGACSSNFWEVPELTAIIDDKVQPMFSTTNLSATEAGKIAIKILQKQDFTITQAIGRDPGTYILGKSFSVMYNKKRVHFRAIDFSYSNVSST